ncbi:E3 ubiquitin-protein ligase RHA1B [Apostasia shenzhenica]|uniref:E3 ubiquitin-protein ligase RHA1B n=1 Tax=Apostasia shenzhenica TaxID=1088818 RepID=A0A2H9ZS21_9ASPA|nr:E3 ubiquitin-protein ligase RHA1B [Apostasia shenzhenica]
MAGGSGQRAICTICFEDLKPIVEDLQSIPICGHVFHEICIQQWYEYCSAGKKPSCPVCKQFCSRDDLSRLYFQSTGESTQFSSENPDSDGQALAEKVRRLEGKLMVVTSTFESQQELLKKVNAELSTWKQLANKEEMMKEEIKKEMVCSQHFLLLKIEELSRKNIECSKLEERCLGLAKELAALKLATDINLEEEDVMKLASIGHGNNTENAVDVLKKSLTLRNKSYKDLMIQCNILGRSQSRALQKLGRAKEKIKKLKKRLLEVEKELEGKENEVLRDLKASYKSKSKHSSLCSTKQKVGCHISTVPFVDKAMRHHEATEMSNQMTSPSNGPDLLCDINSAELWVDKSVQDYEGSNAKLDLAIYSGNLVGLDTLKLIHDSNEHCVYEVACEDGQVYRDATPYSEMESSSILKDKNSYPEGSQPKDDCKGAQIIIEQNPIKKMRTITTEKIVMDDIHMEVHLDTVKKEPQAYASLACLGSTSILGRHVGADGVTSGTGRWCKQVHSKSSNSGDLIAVGADGRGGRIKVLRSREKYMEGSAKPLSSKKQKNSSKQTCQFNIEHFFVKTESP